MKHLECLDVHELVFHEARVFIRSSVHTFDKNCLVSEDLWQENFHSSQILLMRERRAVVVLAAPDGDVGLPTIADPIFLIKHQDGSLDLGCCSTKRDGALVILADIKTSFGSQILGDGISCF